MPVYHALSIQQPWANLIRDGRKTIETRTWATPYRGPLLLCASKVPSIDPCGCTICLADLVDCRVMSDGDWPAACIDPGGVQPRMDAATERLLGSGPWLLPHRTVTYGWHLANIRPLPSIPVQGRLKIFTVELSDLHLRG